MAVKPKFNYEASLVDKVETYRIVKTQSTYLNSLRKRIKTTIKEAVHEGKSNN